MASVYLTQNLANLYAWVHKEYVNSLLGEPADEAVSPERAQGDQSLGGGHGFESVFPAGVHLKARGILMGAKNSGSQTGCGLAVQVSIQSPVPVRCACAGETIETVATAAATTTRKRDGRRRPVIRTSQEAMLWTQSFGGIPILPSFGFGEQRFTRLAVLLKDLAPSLVYSIEPKNIARMQRRDPDPSAICEKLRFVIDGHPAVKLLFAV